MGDERQHKVTLESFHDACNELETREKQRNYVLMYGQSEGIQRFYFSKVNQVDEWPRLESSPLDEPDG